MGGGGVFPKPPTSPFPFPTLTFALSRAVKHAVSLTLSFICMSCAMRKRATHSCSHSAAHAAGLYNSYNCFYNIFGARHSNLSSSERFIELRPQFLVLVSPFGLFFFFLLLLFSSFQNYLCALYARRTVSPMSCCLIYKASSHDFNLQMTTAPKIDLLISYSALQVDDINQNQLELKNKIAT